MFTCGVPRDLVTFNQIVGWDQAIFGKSSLSPDRAKQLFQKRPEIYTAILNSSGWTVAYSDVYPLQASWAQLFVAGEISEGDFTADMVLDKTDDHEHCHFYVGSVVVDPTFDPIMKAVLMGGLLRWRAHQFQSWYLRRVSLLFCPVTPAGQKLVARVRAAKLGHSTNRKDGHNLYGLRTTPSALHDFAIAIDGFLTAEVIRLNLNEPLQCA